jgi:hypothetical protein
VEEGVVERGMLLRPDEREDGVAQQREVPGSFGFAPRPAVLAPLAGVLFPVVFVFHRPMAAGDFSEPCVARVFFFQTGDELTGFAFEVRSALLFAMPTGQAHQLPRSGEEGLV